MGIIDTRDIFGTAKWEQIDKKLVSSKKRIEWTPAVEESCRKLCSDSIKLASLELLSLAESEQVLESEREITTEDEVEEWLSEEPLEYEDPPDVDYREAGSSSAASPLRPAKLRLLYGYLTERTHAKLRFPFNLASLKMISDKFHHSEEHVEGYINELLDDLAIRQWSGKLRYEDGSEYDQSEHKSFYIRAPVYGFSEGFGNNGFCVLSVVHNPSTNVTQALLLCARRMSHLPAVISRLKISPEIGASKPFFLATTLAKVALLEHRETLASAIKAIFGVSNQLGYTTPYETDEPLENDKVEGEPMNMDFMVLTKNVQMILNTLSYTQEAINRQLLMLKIYGEIDEGTEEAEMPRMEGMKSVLAELRWDNEALLLLCARNFVLANSLSAVIYNFMTLQEARVNRELAQSSKTIAEATLRDGNTMKTIAEATLKDSSAMKSIAVLTMVFLPATAVAGVLDTPFFSWDEEGGSNKLTTRGFSAFWIVTIPLTVAVLLIWIIVARPEQEWTRRMKQTWRSKEVETARIHSGSHDCSCSTCKPGTPNGTTNARGQKTSLLKHPFQWTLNQTGDMIRKHEAKKIAADMELGNISHVASRSKTSLAAVAGLHQTGRRISWTPSGTAILRTGDASVHSTVEAADRERIDRGSIDSTRDG